MNSNWKYTENWYSFIKNKYQITLASILPIEINYIKNGWQIRFYWKYLPELYPTFDIARERVILKTKRIIKKLQKQIINLEQEVLNVKEVD